MDLGLLRLVAQRVAGPPLADPVSVVRHLLAVQGQDAPGAVRSIALRSVDRSGQSVLDAYDSGALVRSWPMRGTLHVVLASDLGWMRELMTARPRAAAARRRGDLGLSERDVSHAADVAADELSGRGLVRAGLLEAFAAAVLPAAAGRRYPLLVELAHRGLICLGPHDGGEQRFVLVDSWIRAAAGPTGEDAVAELALRYVLGHGPATDRDLARWAGLPLGQVRRGLSAAAGQLSQVRLGEDVYWIDPALPDLLAGHRSQAEAVHLLPGFDEMVLGYADRTATVPPDVADRVVPGGNGVFRGTVVHRGVAVGTWSRTRTGVAVEPFGQLSERTRRAIDRAVDRLP